MYQENVNYVFVDMQGFKSNSNKFIVKEFAALTKNIQFHDIIKSPCPLIYLDANHQKQINWLTRNYHGLEWNHGFINISELRRTIIPIFDNKTVYIKGVEKKQWLQQILGYDSHICEIINLETFGCAVQLNKNNQDIYRNFHACKNHKASNHQNNCHCAFRNVLILRNWYFRDRKAQ